MDVTTRNRCQIPGCGRLVAGCELLLDSELNRSHPAMRLCRRHYFWMTRVCEPEIVRPRHWLIAQHYGQVHLSESEKLFQWYAGYVVEKQSSGLIQ